MLATPAGVVTTFSHGQPTGRVGSDDTEGAEGVEGVEGARGGTNTDGGVAVSPSVLHAINRMLRTNAARIAEAYRDTSTGRRPLSASVFGDAGLGQVLVCRDRRRADAAVDEVRAALESDRVELAVMDHVAAL